MITKQDLLQAIAECQGTRSPNANTAIKLAAFYTILDHMNETQNTKSQPGSQPVVQYSFAEPPERIVQFDGESDFAKTINGKQQSDVWPIIDELMSTIQALNERLYDGVMRKLH